MFAAAATTSSSLETWQRQQQRRLLPQRRPHSRGGGGAPSSPRFGPLPSHSDTANSGGGRGGVGTAAAASSRAPGEGRQEGSPRAFVGAGAGAAAAAAATAAAAGNHTGSSVPGCSSCCHDDDVTDATTGGGKKGGCVCGEERAVSSWGRGSGGKGREPGGRPSGTSRRGPSMCFLPRPRARSESWGCRKARPAQGAGDRWLGRWARLPGWGAAEGGGGGAPMSWMGSEGLAGGGRQCSGPFRWLGGIGRSRGDRARLADRHFTFCRVGGGSRGNGFLQGKKTRPRGGEAQPSCRCCLAGGRAADAAGPSQVTQRPRAWPRGGARGGGVRARASAYKRAAQPFVPARGARPTAPPLQLLFCSVCARPLNEFYSRSALLRFARAWQMQCTGISHRGVFLPPLSSPLALVCPSLVSS